jgi:uncharacterized protein (DUF169 family)
MDHADIASRFQQHLGLTVSPVAVCFSSTPPPGVARVERAEAAGCAYWRRAAAGEVFFTVLDDHLGCAVGAYTHGADLTGPRLAELEGLVATMVGLSYLSADEVASIPRRAAALEVVSYAPLARSPAPPDVVLLRCSPRAAMLLAEAAHAAGLKEPAPWGMRPACAMVPELLASRRASSSLGCVGNRVHTGIPDHELWCGVAAAALGPTVERLEVIARANRELESFHRERAVSV